MSERRKSYREEQRREYNPFISPFSQNLAKLLKSRNAWTTTKQAEVIEILQQGNPLQLMEALTVCTTVLIPELERKMTSGNLLPRLIAADDDEIDKVRAQILTKDTMRTTPIESSRIGNVRSLMNAIVQLCDTEAYWDALSSFTLRAQEYVSLVNMVSNIGQAINFDVILYASQLAQQIPQPQASKKFTDLVNALNPGNRFAHIAHTTINYSEGETIPQKIYRYTLAKARIALETASKDRQTQYQAYLQATTPEERSTQGNALLASIMQENILAQLPIKEADGAFNVAVEQLFTALRGKKSETVLTLLATPEFLSGLTPDQINLLSIVLFEPVPRAGENINQETIQFMDGLSSWQSWFVSAITYPAAHASRMQAVAKVLGRNAMLMYASRLMAKDVQRHIFHQDYTVATAIMEDTWIRLARSSQQWNASPEMFQALSIYAIREFQRSQQRNLLACFAQPQEQQSYQNALMQFNQSLLPESQLIAQALNYFAFDEDIALQSVSMTDTMLDNAKHVGPVLDAQASQTVSHIVEHWDKLPVIAGEIRTFVVLMPSSPNTTNLTEMQFSFIGQDTQNWCAFVSITSGDNNHPIPAVITSEGHVQLLIPDTFLPEGVASIFRHSIGFVLSLLLSRQDRIESEPYQRPIASSTPKAKMDAGRRRARRPQALGLPVTARYAINKEQGLTRETRPVTPHSVPPFIKNRAATSRYRETVKEILQLQKQIEDMGTAKSPLRSELEAQLTELLKIHATYVNQFQQPTPRSGEPEIDEVTRVPIYISIQVKGYTVGGNANTPQIRRAVLKEGPAQALLEIWHFLGQEHQAGLPLNNNE